MRASIILLSCSLAVPVAALAADAHFERKLEVGSSPSVSVNTGSGTIRVRRGSDHELHVTGHVHANGGNWSRGGNPEQTVQQIASNPPIQQNGNQVAIGPRHNDELFRNVSIDYEITLPEGSALELSSGSGDVEVDGVGASLRAGSGSGSVRARGVRGPANLHSGSGDIELTEAAGGEVRSETGSGSIRIRDFSGPLHARTGSGDIEANGQITGDSMLQTGSGSVRLRLGPQAHFSLDATTGSGSVRTEQPISMQGDLNRHHVNGAVNGGGPALRVITGSGDIEIH